MNKNKVKPIELVGDSTMVIYDLENVTLKDLAEGFRDESETTGGVFGWNGKLIIRPDFQRSYVVDDSVSVVAVTVEVVVSDVSEVVSSVSVTVDAVVSSVVETVVSSVDTVVTVSVDVSDVVSSVDTEVDVVVTCSLLFLSRSRVPRCAFDSWCLYE